MVPPFRQRLDEQLGRRERTLLVVLAAAVLLIGIAATAWTIHQFAADRQAGCVSVTVPGTLGGDYFRYCGDEARQWCGAEYATHDDLAARAQAACAAAGYRPNITTGQ